MSSWAWWLVLGLLLGWAIEWVIDWIYWRGRRQAILADLAAARANEGRLRAELDKAQGAARQYQNELGALRLASADLDSARNATLQYKHELGALQTQASELRAENDRLRAELSAAQAKIGGAAQSKQTLLLDAGQISSLPPAATPGAQQAEGETVRTRAVGAAATLQEQRRDPLIDINGIGPVYERRLFDAGVYTFADLATLAPERIREIIKAERWQEIAAEAWIAEARLRAEQSRSESS